MNHVYQIYFEQSIFVLLLFLSRRTFDTGWSGSMEMDKVPQRQSGLHRQHTPHRERLFLSVWRVYRQSCPNLIRNKRWTLLFEDRWAIRPSSRFIMYCKRVKSTDESHDKWRWKYKSSNDNQWVAWNKKRKVD